MKTALVDEKPIIRLLSDSPAVGQAFANQLEASGFRVLQLPDGVSLNEAERATIYKNLVVLSGGGQLNSSLSGSNLPVVTLTQLDSSSQIPLYPEIATLVVVPLWREVIATTPPHWQSLFAQNQDLIHGLLANLPLAKTVFVGDWLPSSPSEVKSRLLASFVPDEVGQLRVPSGLLYPLTTADIVERVSHLLQQPHSSRSVLIRGEAVASASFVSETVALYDTYHQTSTAINLEGELASLSTPFPVQEIKVSAQPQALARQLARLLRLTGEDPFPSLARLLAISGQVRAPATSISTSPPILPSISFPTSSPTSSSTPNKTSPSVLSSPPDSSSTSSVVPPSTSSLTPLPTSSSLPSSSSPAPISQAEVMSEIDQLFVKKRSVVKHQQVRKLEKQENEGGKKNRRRQGFFWLGSISSGIAIGILVMIGFFFLTSSLYLQAYTKNLRAFESGGQPFITRLTRPLTTMVAWQAEFLGKFVESELVAEIQTKLSLNQRLDVLFSLKEQEAKLREAFFSHLANQDEQDLRASLSNLEMVISRRAVELSTLRSLLDQDVEKGRDLTEVETTLAQAQKWLGYFSQLGGVLSSILGVGEEKHYAVVLLDSAELRPTGGFIQAVALINLAEGRISSFRVLTSYEIDQKLGGVVEAPADLARLLGEKAWYFRDSNWDADHPASAERILWFLKKSLNLELDGVISLPSHSLAQLLTGLEPIHLGDFNEAITPQNLEKRLLFYHQAESAQTRQAFPSALLQGFFSLLTKQSSQDWRLFLHNLNQDLESANIQLFFVDPQAQEAVQNLGWSGALIKPTCPTQFAKTRCLVDYIFQTETNIGVNKVGGLISREVKHRVEIGNGQVTHTRTTTIENKAETSAWPLGSYRLYLKWYLPTEAELDSLSIAGARVVESSIDRELAHGYQSLAVLLEVPIQSSREISLVYHQPQTTTLPHTYMFFDQKQAGVTFKRRQLVVSRLDRGTPTRVAPAPRPSQNTQDELIFDQEKTTHSVTVIEYR